MRTYVRWLILAYCIGCPTVCLGETRTFDITVNAGGLARNSTPVTAMIELPTTFPEGFSAKLSDAQGGSIDVQLTRPGLLGSRDESPSMSRRWEAHFVLPELPSDGVWNGRLEVTGPPSSEFAAKFAWAPPDGKSTELRFEGRPLLRYMYEPLDESTPERRAETYKVYHHVFDPTGQTLLTKGPGGLYPHHRGLYYGFNRISYGDGQKADTWHCTHGAYQSHEGFLGSDVGRVLGRHVIKVDWHGQEGKVFAQEERELSAYALPGGTLIEFASRLTSTVGPVKLDGDPQHAGFQFRAAQEVADATSKETYYIRPLGKGAPGETLNWPEAKEMVNLPWHAMSCVIGGQRYTIARLDHPRNPGESRYSERDYGRFGSYFEYDLDVGNPLDVNYRVWVQAGEMTAEEIDAKSRDFVQPVDVTVTRR